MFERLIAATFIIACFSALPLWFLARVEGRVRFVGGGAPWRCTVERHWLWRTKTDVYEPTRIESLEREVSYKTRTSPAWQIRFQQGDQRTEILAGVSTDRAVVRIAEQLEAARAKGAPIEVSLPAGGVYYLAIALVVIFAASGAFLAFSR